jgi:carboxylate-amine ligase
MSGDPLPAFSAYGIELEYMIVDRETLAVRPLADAVLRDDEGVIRSDIDRGATGWSNEVVLHLIELKNPRPTSDLGALHAAFKADIDELNRVLATHRARLMPTGMHPWMDPVTETSLWPHEHADIYRTFDSIFNCSQHGWANLQSMHINLPFQDDAEFARLHAAARLALPLLPALAASSPLIEGGHRYWLDTRMAMYREHEQRVPSLLGAVVPDTFASRDEYETRALAPMYRDIAPHDPEGVLRHEWINGHGLIARFDRHAIEIRVVDMQECCGADLAIAAATIAFIRRLYEHPPTSLQHQQAIPTGLLAQYLDATICDADAAVIADADYLRAIGFPVRHARARDLWRHVIAEYDATTLPWLPTLDALLREGPLARRILRALSGDFSCARMSEVYRRLCDCLAEGEMFHA